MNKDKMKKGGLMGGLGAVVVATVVGIYSLLGNTVNVVGEFTLVPSDYTSTFRAVEIVGQVPNATFYELAVENADGLQTAGVQTYGVDDGITVPTIIVTPLDNVRILVYNKDMETIGIGTPKVGGKIEYDIKDSEVVNNE